MAACVDRFEDALDDEQPGRCEADHCMEGTRSSSSSDGAVNLKPRSLGVGVAYRLLPWALRTEQ
jgi:hypothetical protein